MRDPEDVLRRDRDMRTLFSSWLEAELAEISLQHTAATRHLECENQRLGELVLTTHEENEQLGVQLIELERRYGDNQQWARELETAMLKHQQSRSRYLVNPFRALMARRRT